ncbi:unnamed protein product [Ilex paraguariensis]|uniref:Uncharacterized protein n=1 Tax=Ilex paraguariensis TaxID=185542 RepID=A0ABC8T044_9AQUA
MGPRERAENVLDCGPRIKGSNESSNDSINQSVTCNLLDMRGDLNFENKEFRGVTNILSVDGLQSDVLDNNVKMGKSYGLQVKKWATSSSNNGRTLELVLGNGLFTLKPIKSKEVDSFN